MNSQRRILGEIDGRAGDSPRIPAVRPGRRYPVRGRLATAGLLLGLAWTGGAEALPLVSSGWSASAEPLLAVEFASFDAPRRNEVTLGLGDLSRPEERVSKSLRWAAGANDFLVTYDRGRNRLVTRIENAHGAWSFRFGNLSRRLAVPGYEHSLSEMNRLEIGTVDPAGGGSLELRDLYLDGLELPAIGGPGSRRWSVSGQDFGQGFTLAGRLFLDGAFPPGDAESALRIRVAAEDEGGLMAPDGETTPVVPEPGTMALLGTGLLGSALFVRRRR